MKIAVFLPNWIGDLVMATPAVRALRERHPAAELIAVGKPYVNGVLDGAPWFQHVLNLDRQGPWKSRWPAVARSLRRHRPDISVLFPNTFRSAWVAWLAGSKRIVGFNRYGRGLLLTDRLEALRDGDGGFQPTPIINDYNKLAMLAGTADPGFRMELFTTPANESAADVVWQKAGFDRTRDVVSLNPGAAFGASKYWDLEYFAELARNFVDRRGCSVLILCGPSERELARDIATLADRPQVHSLADSPVSLGLTKAVVKRSALLITTDSGPRHFAAAFNRPVVTLFGPTHIAWTETYYAKAIHLQKKVSCGPCQQRVCPTGDHRCMKELLPAEVFQAAGDLLLRTSERKAS